MYSMCPFLSFPEKQDCDTDGLQHLLLATNSPDSDPYRPDPQVNVQFVKAGQYRVFNRTSVPFIYFEVPKNQSLLKPFFPDTTVKDDSTLKAELERQEDQWLLHVQGELEKCPGRFSWALLSDCQISSSYSQYARYEASCEFKVWSCCLSGNDGISNTIPLEMPYFTIKTAICVPPSQFHIHFRLTHYLLADLNSIL